MSAEKVEHEIDRQTGAQSPVVQKPYWPDVVQRQSSPPFASTVTGDQEIDVAKVFGVEALLLRAPPNVRCEKLAPIGCVILIKQKIIVMFLSLNFSNYNNTHRDEKENATILLNLEALVLDVLACICT